METETEAAQILVTFTDPAFPTFEFINWKPGISMGSIERCTQLMIREAEKQQSILKQKLRVDEAALNT